MYLSARSQIVIKTCVRLVLFKFLKVRIKLIVNRYIEIENRYIYLFIINLILVVLCFAE